MNVSDTDDLITVPMLPLWSYRIERNSTLAVTTRAALEARLIARALKDAEFRRSLVADPRAVIESELGAPLSAGISVRVHEESATSLFVVLPSNPSQGSGPFGLSAEDAAEWVGGVPGVAALGDAAGASLIVRSWTDAGFRRELIESPSAVLGRELGREFPAGVEVSVLEETPELIHIVLPSADLPDGWDEGSIYTGIGEMMWETDMVMVAGSGGFNCGFTCVCTNCCLTACSSTIIGIPI